MLNCLIAFRRGPVHDRGSAATTASSRADWPSTRATCLPPPVRPAILGGMDQERDHYADRDLPPPRWLPPLHVVLALLGVVLLVGMVAAACLFGMVPKARD